MTNKQEPKLSLDEIFELDKKRTQGEWLTNEDLTSVGLKDHQVGYPSDDISICSLDDMEYIRNKNAKSDAPFIAAAPDMILHLKRLTEQLRIAKEALFPIKLKSLGKQKCLTAYGQEFEGYVFQVGEMKHIFDAQDYEVNGGKMWAICNIYEILTQQALKQINDMENGE